MASRSILAAWKLHVCRRQSFNLHTTSTGRFFALYQLRSNLEGTAIDALPLLLRSRQRPKASKRAKSNLSHSPYFHVSHAVKLPVDHCYLLVVYGGSFRCVVPAAPNMASSFSLEPVMRFSGGSQPVRRPKVSRCTWKKLCCAEMGHLAIDFSKKRGGFEKKKWYLFITSLQAVWIGIRVLLLRWESWISPRWFIHKILLSSSAWGGSVSWIRYFCQAWRFQSWTSRQLAENHHFSRARDWN